jgi:hypothetical protein
VSSSDYVGIPVMEIGQVEQPNFDVGGDYEDEDDVDDMVEEDPIRYITAHVNGTSGAGKVVMAPDSVTRLEFFDAAAVALGLPGALTRMFTRSGAEIVDDMDAVLDGEELWLSEGGEFHHP